VFFLFFVGKKRIVRIEAFEKLKQQNFNLYAQFNIEMGVPMKRDYLAYLTGFEKSNMGEKINEYTGKRVLDFCLKRPNISCFTDQITILL
jgi:hypothetical protein